MPELVELLRALIVDGVGARSENLLMYIVVGVIGGVVRELSMRRNVLILPRRVKTKEVEGVDLGVVGTIICSVFVAVVTDHSVATAAMASVGAPHLIESWSRRFGGKHGNVHHRGVGKEAD